MKNDWAETTRRWLGRLSFSFLVVAFFLGWEGHRRYVMLGGAARDWRMLLDFIGAALALLMGLRGLRERHKGRGR